MNKSVPKEGPVSTQSEHLLVKETLLRVSVVEGYPQKCHLLVIGQSNLCTASVPRQAK